MIEDSYDTGDYVRIRSLGTLGRIYQRWTGTRRCPYNDDYLAGTTQLGPEPMRFVNSQWVGVLQHRNGDSIWVPVDILERVEPFRLSHYDYRYYFNDAW